MVRKIYFYCVKVEFPIQILKETGVQTRGPWQMWLVDDEHQVRIFESPSMLCWQRWKNCEISSSSSLCPFHFVWQLLQVCHVGFAMQILIFEVGAVKDLVGQVRWEPLGAKHPFPEKKEAFWWRNGIENMSILKVRMIVHVELICAIS